MKNILAPGGKLFASDGNNGANPYIAIQRKQKWREAESAGGRIYEARKRFIIEKFSSLSDETSLNYLVQHTCYQRSDELIQNIQYFLSSGRLNKAQAFIDGKTPYDPEHCFLPNEDLLYPAEELRSIRAVGLVP